MSVRPYILIALAALVSLAGCTAAQPLAMPSHSDSADTPVTVYIARRKWHIDVGFAAADLDAALLPVRSEFPAAKYLFFGFGDRHYLLTKHKSAPLLLSALWPGPAVLLVTAIKDPPDYAFGASEVVKLEVNAAQARALQTFIRNSIPGATLHPLGTAGPYEGSLYYPASQRYSALHTCNTWAAEVLRAGGEPVHSTAVVFAGQLWQQVTRLRAQLQGGLVPS